MKAFLEKQFYNNTLQEWAFALFIVLGSILAAKVAYWLFRKVIKPLTDRTKSNFDNLLIDRLEEPVVFGLGLFGIWMGMEQLHFEEWLQAYINGGFRFVLAINITWMIARLVDALIAEYIVPLTEKTESDLDDQLMPIVRKGIRTIIWMLGVITALNNVGFDVGALIAGLGIGGLALAMAAKDTVSNFFGGIMIFTDKPFKIKERVKIGGYDGTIEEIGIRSTRLKTLEGRIVTIPNAKFTDSMVENVTMEPSRKVVLNLGMTYDTSHDQMELAMRLLRNIAVANDNLEENITVGFNSFGDFSLGILFVYFIKKEADIMQTQTEINMSILKLFGENNLEFAFPTQTIYTIKGEA